MKLRTVRRLALGLCGALASALLARFAMEQTRAGRLPRDDFVEAWLAAVAQLPQVPATAALGFVTTIDPEQPEARLFLTRYALAPRMVYQGAGQPLVVGHFRSPADAEEVSRREGFSILGASGDGLFLLRRATP